MNNKELTKELEIKISNQKAKDFFGQDIVKKLEEQHMDDFPKYFKEVQNNVWQYGVTSKYIVEFNNKNYVVTMEDNVLVHPLYINVIVGWEEVWNIN